MGCSKKTSMSLFSHMKAVKRRNSAGGTGFAQVRAAIEKAEALLEDKSN